MDVLAKRLPSARFEMLRYKFVRICCEQYHSLINISYTEHLTSYLEIYLIDLEILPRVNHFNGGTFQERTNTSCTSRI